ncbi:MAG: S1C family serine protease [Cyclobacteriaceae bacterium]|jgi:serine protease Do
MRNRLMFVAVVVGLAMFGAVVGSFFTLRMVETETGYSSIQQRQRTRFISARDSIAFRHAPISFQDASAASIPAVVHIRTNFGAGSFSLNPLEYHFNPEAHSSGSGVILTDDGFIVTNYHVIEDASNIEVVTSSNQRYFARLVGRDESTDLALLKVKASGLPFVRYGDSDQVSPGDWVLAVGNPFDLNSTVTAGIVSAKARNIGILRDRNNLQVESFIQTDAAVNPGNSGGALVNLRGELIGINSAIATNTGNYAGYSFAIPSNLVRKIMDDLLEFGQVQRGLLGVEIRDVTPELAEDEKLPLVQGVYILRVNHGSAAEQAGLAAGDVITQVDRSPINTVSELQERVARNRPGQSVQITYWRDGIARKVKAVLRNFEGEVEVTTRTIESTLGGGEFENIAYRELAELNLEGGVRLLRKKSGPWVKAQVPDGFVITHIDKVEVENLESLNRILEIKRGGVLVEGLHPSGERGTFGIDWLEE